MTERRNRDAPHAADDTAKRDRYKAHLDERLDEALKETFPASDPIAVTPRRPPPRATDKARGAVP
jgi:hypothetical protein